MRRNGRSLPEIAHDELGVVTGTATAVAVLFIVVVALAGLGFAVVNALYHNAWGTFTIAMTIPIGFVMGFYLQRFRPGAIAEVSLLGVAFLIIAVLMGRVVAQSSVASWFEYEKATLVWLLAGYGFLASVLPGWMLLVPRGYLSTFMKLGVVFLLGLGVIVLAPTLQMPRVTPFLAGGGPIIPGELFPFLFITIACGAVSGFHALVSSGTTPKMIERESQALVGYAAMLLESFVGVMALIAATVRCPAIIFRSIQRCQRMRSRSWVSPPKESRSFRAWWRLTSRDGRAVPCLWRWAWLLSFRHYREWLGSWRIGISLRCCSKRCLFSRRSTRERGLRGISYRRWRAGFPNRSGA